ncbi:error-prone DNA polymerase [Henriciella sp. AS95]|uniref:error-prone DNA polymerase n=1 Tax=Henriciella sp. AS95 TaxID=3135782 RepID=UPI00317D2557
MTRYAELAVTTNFSFLHGASHAEELVLQAVSLGLEGIGIADRNTLAGVVRAHLAAKEHGLRLAIGVRLIPADGPEMLCYPTDKAAYGRLSKLLSEGKLRAEKGECLIHVEDIVHASEGQIFIFLPPEKPGEDFFDLLERWAENRPHTVYLGVSFRFRGRDRERIARLADQAARVGVPIVAINDVLYHHPERRPLQDIVTCIREHCSIEQAGYRLEANGERHLKPAAEMARLFKGFEPAIARTAEILERCKFSLDELSYHYPDEPVPPGKTPQQHLEDLTWAGADWRYPGGVPETVRKALEKELNLIAGLDYAPYFLTVHDIVAWARGEGILCQGRGSAANSAVCYCIGITSVDPSVTSLLFERFLSKERKEPPDIDVDFEHERREEVIQYVYRRYGRHRAALTATVICYRPRSAVREVCKALGLSEDISSALAGTVWGAWGSEINTKQICEAGLDPNNPMIRRAIILTRQLIGFPRHLSQHVGGFVLTQGLLTETVPIGNAAMDERTFIEWDKDDISALNIMKVDVLALGMLTCIRKAFDFLKLHKGIEHDLASIPQGDPATYDMLCEGDSLGVFQVESRAQMNMLPRLRPRTFYDLVIEVAIVRPGPIQGDMVHPYLRRRKGLESVSYPSPAPEFGPPDELEKILKRTLGVPLFQEQAMQISIDAACFTADEANGLRRAMATFRKVGTIQNYEELMVSRMIARGYDPAFAHRCFDQVKGFGEYGFPESHAASFALLVYVSSWLKKHHPDVFCAALLNSQPMGFYAPAQIVRDAQEHGVEIRPIDVNLSDWDNTLEPDGQNGFCAVRLGFRQVEGVREDEMEALMEARRSGYEHPEDIRRRTGIGRRALEQLAAADAFGSIGMDRRAALWAVRGETQGKPLPLFAATDAPEQQAELPVDLPQMPTSEHVLQDYQMTRLSLKEHPMSFLRQRYDSFGLKTTAEANLLHNGARVRTAGVVLVRQRPGSASGVYFVTLEDETGIANLVIWPRVGEVYRPTLMGARIMLVNGRVQTADNVTHIVANQLIDLTSDLHLLSEEAQFDPLKGALARADEVQRPIPERKGPPARSAGRHPRDVRIIPASRDFH